MGKCALSLRAMEERGREEGAKEGGREVLPLDLSSSYITFTCSALLCSALRKSENTTWAVDFL